MIVLFGSDGSNSCESRADIPGIRVAAIPRTITAGIRIQRRRLITAMIKAMTASASKPPRERLKKVDATKIATKPALINLTQRSRS